jgi:hypothetical protein|tara:strand:- start:2706 stop:2903 length:198 start_codon:yes stop_codon:yes gene_type:complete
MGNLLIGLIIGGAGLLWFSHHRACNCGCGRKFCTCLNQVKIEEKPKKAKRRTRRKSSGKSSDKSI